MCGIVACTTEDSNPEFLARNLLKKIEHRGPDNTNFFSDSNISLGSCRLSIMDLSNKANMPMIDRTGRFVIVYNGEIYNFKDLKKKFQISTETVSDTEVILELYAKFKEKCLNELNGIFSFVIFDKLENNFFCARDPIGVKPFYYFYNNVNFIASSEIKSFSEFNSKNLNLQVVKKYLTTSFYDYGKNTFFENIYQLQPGHYLNYSIKNKNLEIIRYYLLSKKKVSKKILEEKDIIKAGSDLILNSFKIQMQTDTNLSVNLSSGLDSKIMLSCLDKINNGQKTIKANSFFFQDKYFNERSDLEIFAKHRNWNINFFKISPEDVIHNFDEILYTNDGPFPGLPTIGKSLLIKKSCDPSYKVILEGQGGDDIAGGYKYIFGYFLKDLIKSGEFKNFFLEIEKFSKIENLNVFNVLRLFFKSFNSLDAGGISADGTKSINLNVLDKNLLYLNNLKINDFNEDLMNISGDLKKIIYRDIFYTKLQRILKSCDRVSMAYGKELRVPLLDKRIVSFFYNLENNQVIKNGNLRYIYRKIAGNLIDNKDEFIKKKYVIDPQTSWIKNELYDWIYSILEDNKTKHDGIFNTKKLLMYLENFKTNNEVNNSNLLWQALCLRRLQQII